MIFNDKTHQLLNALALVNVLIELAFIIHYLFLLVFVRITPILDMNLNLNK